MPERCGANQLNMAVLVLRDPQGPAGNAALDGQNINMIRILDSSCRDCWWQKAAIEQVMRHVVSVLVVLEGSWEFQPVRMCFVNLEKAFHCAPGVRVSTALCKGPVHA